MEKITFEREKCIGCGACAAVCPVHWKMGDDGKSQLLESQENDQSDVFQKEVGKAGCAKDAADGCPVQCIRVE